ncbi:Ulp1 family isopeptidase [Mesorhizobium ciceri]|uniref:Ulp1 family isopeptidase n=1 Tax=Mesorhizobium ciceri TaxID=39645 RepID=UPI00375689E8
MGEGQADQARQVGYNQHLAEARRLLDQADESPTNPEEVLRLEQGFREVLQLRQHDQAASSFFSDPGMPARRGDLNSIVADAFAATGSGHAGVEAAAPPPLAASQQQTRPWPEALDQSNRLLPEWVIINDEHYTALVRPAERQRVLNTPQAAAIQPPRSEIGNSGGRVPMQPLVQQLGELPLEAVPVQGRGSEHTRRLHAEAAPFARSEAPPAAIEYSINVSFAVPKDFSHGIQRVPDAMLSFVDRHDPLPNAGRTRQARLEQHVAEPRRASGDPATRYPHLSDEHRDVIDKAIADAEAQQHHSAGTLRIYSAALRRLANDLGARGQATDLKNHQSLVDHVDAFLPKNGDIKTALNFLRAYHEPGYSAPGRRPVPSKADAHLLEQVANDSRLAPGSRAVYGRKLRRFSEALESQGRTISGLDHDSRIEFAERLFPGNRNLLSALQRVSDTEPASDRIMADAFAAAGFGHAGVEAAAPPTLAASQHRPWPDALDQGNHLPPERVIINDEHYTALVRPAETQRALNTPQAAAIQQPPSEIGISGGRVPMQPPMQQLGELPLEAVPVQGTGSEYTRRLHAEAAPSARYEALPAAIEDSINVSFAVPKGFYHGTQPVPDAMLPFVGRNDPLPDAGQARQAGFEPHVAEPRRGGPVASGARATGYPHLSDEHRDLIDKAIAHAAAQQKLSVRTLQNYRRTLRRLANDLGARGQATDLKNHQSLVDHVDAFFPKNDEMKPALSVLRAYHEPGYSATRGWRVPVPSKADVHLLEQVANDSRLAPSSRAVYGSILRRFSEVLESQGLTISGLDHDSRIEFAERLFPGYRNLLSALQRVGDAEPASDRIMADAFAAAGSGHAGVEAAAPPTLAASQHRPWPDALDQGNHLPPERFIINNEHDTAPLRPTERQWALNPLQAAAIQQPLSEGGRVPMQPPMQHLGELPLAGVPVQGTGSEHIGSLHAEAGSFARSDAPPAAVEDFINIPFAVPEGFSHGTQRVPDAMLSSLYHHGLLPDADQPEWNYEIKGQGYTARRPEGGNDVWLVHRGAMREAAAAAVLARAPGHALPATAMLSDTYRGVPFVDLTSSSDARIGASPSGSSNLPEGAVLGADLLGDAHIHRDYRLLEQDLQVAHPALAARTRLVDPLVSQQLRRHDRDAQLTLLSIYHHSDVAADFVFLPVNSGNPLATGENQGRTEHWSLLLVDRRDPERAVAYHYDSIHQRDGRGYNDAPARELAARLDATALVTPEMARQNNGVDCGVFMLDGTRALVQRLANQEWPERQRPLHLDKLVADRQALQNRLRQGRLPHELAAIPAEALGAAGSQVQHAVLQEQQARQVAPAPFDQHLSKSREAPNELPSPPDGSNRVNSGGVIINTEHYTALVRPAKRQRTENPQSLAMGRQASEADTSSIRRDSDQARADLMASSRSRERSDAGR